MHARGWEINPARGLATVGDVSMEIQGTWACLDSPLKWEKSFFTSYLVPWRKRHNTWWASSDFGGNIYYIWAWCSDPHAGSVVGDTQRKDSSKSRQWYKMLCHLMSYSPTDPVASVADRNALWSLWWDPVKESHPRLLGFQNKVMFSSFDNYSLFEKQLLDYYWVLVTTEWVSDYDIQINSVPNDLSWTGCYLTHKIIKLDTCSRIPMLNGNGISKTKLRRSGRQK